MGGGRFDLNSQWAEGAFYLSTAPIYMPLLICWYKLQINQGLYMVYSSWSSALLLSEDGRGEFLYIRETDTGEGKGALQSRFHAQEG